MRSSRVEHLTAYMISTGILLVLSLPLFLSIVSLARDHTAWAVWSETSRIGRLLTNTLGLAIGAILVSLPAGTLLALLLERGRVTGVKSLRQFLTLALFIPLPVYAVAWQIVLGSWLPAPALAPGEVAWRPWRQGLLPAAVVHGLAAIPWVVWIVSAIFSRTDSSLEDAARIEGGWGTMIRRVLLPRAVFAAMFAGMWVAGQAATEIPITDAMMVRTLAEDVYTEMVGNPAGVHAAIALGLPIWLLSSVLAIAAFHVLQNRFPPASESNDVIAGSKRTNRLLTVLAWLSTGIVAGIPFLALINRAGSNHGNFQFPALFKTVSTQLRDSGGVVAESLLAAVFAGTITALLSWVVCSTLGRTMRGFSLLVAFAVSLWLVPGPIVGFGLKELIFVLLDGEDAVCRMLGATPTFPPLRSLLYDQPTPIPAIIASTIRFFPLAVALILPAIRAVPAELWDLARLDGLGLVALFRRILIPLTGHAVFRAGVAVAVLSLGEVSASKLVNPPSQRAYILDLFNQMHYGAEATVAGLCLVQVAMTAIVLAVGFGLIRGPSGRPSSMAR
ncbi:MAG: hypothetical protein U0798_01160 [Gemmataceae bacterium]